MVQEASYLQQLNGDLWLVEDERENMKISYRIKEVIFSEPSTFQHVMILDSYDFGRMLVLDGIVQTTSTDGFIYNEMISHIPLSIHPNPERVLIIGGGDCGVVREVTKYDNVISIDMVEIDEMVVKVCKEYLPKVSGNLNDPRVNFLYLDGTKHVKAYKNYYDVIIIDSSDPIGPAKQLFERHFYENIRHALKEDGLMVCQSQSPFFHMNILKQTAEHIKDLFSFNKIYTATIPTYPGGLWSFTLGSKKYKEVITSRIDKNTQYVNEAILHTCFVLPEFIKHQFS